MTDRELLELLLAGQQAMQKDIASLKTDVSNLTQRVDDIELQIKSTERVLKNEIRKSEELVLDEVERVHNILYKHTQDATKHTA